MSIGKRRHRRKFKHLLKRWWLQNSQRILGRRGARLFTGLGMAVSAMLSIGVVFVFYYQQKETLLESTLARQDRTLAEIEQALRQEMERELRQTSLMAHVVRGFQRGTVGRERAYSLLSSDSLAWQLVITHRTEAQHLLWSRHGELQAHLAREFFRFNHDLAISDLGWSRPTAAGDSEPILSVRFKRLNAWQDLEFIASEQGIRQALLPYMLNQGFSLGVVNQDGQWFPLFGSDTSRANPNYGQFLSENVLEQLHHQPRGLTASWTQETGNPFRKGVIIHARRIRAWGDLHWTLVLYGPRTEMDRVLFGQLWRSLWVLLIVALVWGVLSWLLLRRESSLDRLTRDLEHLREMRRKDGQLVRAEKLATAGVLMSGLAHEIGTPLNVLSMRLQLLRRRFEEGSEDAKNVDVLLSQLERVTGLIRQLLDFVRARPMQENAVDLGQTLSTVTNLLEPVARRKKVRLQLELPSVLMPVNGNSGSMQQVFVNLVMNAVQAIEREDGLVRLTAGMLPDGSTQVLVEDNGPGIPKEKRNAIFDPFFTTKKQGEGTGLGLTVVLDLVQRMGGDLHVDASADLGGACFIVKLRRWDGTTAIKRT